MSRYFAFGIFQSKDVLALGHFVPRTFFPGTLRSLAVSVAEMFCERNVLDPAPKYHIAK